MTDPDNLAEMEQYLRDWAADNKCAYDPEGECGFGRECVGIKYGDHWVDLGPEKEHVFMGQRPMWFVESLDEAEPPEGVDNAYHKHPCLVVLGRGPDRIRELYVWVRSIEAAGLVVRVTPREGLKDMNAIQLMISGSTVVHLAKKGDT